MKKPLLHTAAFMLSASLCFGQHNKVNSAEMYLEDYQQHGDTSELTLAKAAIDEAATNEKTSGEPKTFLCRGEIYQQIFQTEVTALNKTMKPAQAYAKADTGAISASAASYIKVCQLATDTKDLYVEEAKQKQNMPNCLLMLQNKAVMEYSNKNYLSSLSLYKKAMVMDSILGIKDTTYIEDISSAAVDASKAGKNDIATKLYTHLIYMKAGGSTPYIGLYNLYIDQKDTTDAMNYLELGRSACPDNITMINLETNIYLARKNSEKAETNLKLFIAKEEQMPDNKKDPKLISSLYYVLGIIYDKRANPKDTGSIKPPRGAEYDTLFARAEYNYNKALVYNPNDVDVLYNLGALYFNRGVAITTKAQSIPMNQQAAYDKAKEEAKNLFLKAQPYFEKAHTIDPNNKDNTNALLAVYNNTGQEDKAKALVGQ